MENDGDLVVLGAGLMRTGTMSLQSALQLLLNGPCYHMSSVPLNPHHIALWDKAALEGLSDDEWKTLFKGCKAAVDMPTAVFYERLMEVYPNAKVILSVRDPHTWHRSVNNTIVKLEKKMETFPINVLVKITPHRLMPKMMADIEKYYNSGQRFPFDDEDATVAFFDRHVKRVISTIPSDRLLVFNASEGWKPLCDFLNVPVPDLPYPHANATENFEGMIKRVIGRAFLKLLTRWIMIGGVLGVLTYQAYARRDSLLSFFIKQ